MEARSPSKVPRNLLGIYILTWNRAEKLRHLLETLIKQVSPYGFPVYVSDNFSKDDTDEVVKAFQKKYKGIVYYKSRKPIGQAETLKRIFRAGKTEYAWLFSDDDELRKGAIDAVVKELMKNYDFLQINTQRYHVFQIYP